MKHLDTQEARKVRDMAVDALRNGLPSVYHVMPVGELGLHVTRHQSDFLVRLDFTPEQPSYA